jgi:hypothetical protein
MAGRGAVRVAREAVAGEREVAIRQLLREFGREREAAVRQVMPEQREAVLALLKSDELVAVVHRASTQCEDVINAVFVRGNFVILLWMVASPSAY